MGGPADAVPTESLSVLLNTTHDMTGTKGRAHDTGTLKNRLRRRHPLENDHAPGNHIALSPSMRAFRLLHNTAMFSKDTGEGIAGVRVRACTLGHLH